MILNYTFHVINSSRQPKLVLSKKDPLEKKLARLASLDGFSINQIHRCQYLRNSFERDNTPMPDSRTTITSKIISYYDERKKAISKFFSEEKNAGKKFSIAADEWTSYSNKRFMNVFLHSDLRSFNLGLIRITGSANAENLKTLFFAKLSEFGLVESDIISLCTDGAAVMMKLGKELDLEHIVCFLHTLNLVIVENVYSKIQIINPESLDQSFDDCSDQEELYFTNESWEISIQDYQENCALVRKIVRYFKVFIIFSGYWWR